VWRIEYAASRQYSRSSSGAGFCGMMGSFGKPVAEPSSDAVQAPPYSSSLPCSVEVFGLAPMKGLQVGRAAGSLSTPS
jgi:hypothetical protein